MSSAKPEERFWSKVEVKGPTECWPWKAAQENGYGSFALDGYHAAHAHRSAFELFYHRKPKGEVLHKCNNKLCVNPHHLYEGDHVANARDLLIEGGGGRRKLSNDQVREIKRLRKTGWYSLDELATKFGCCAQNIGRILNGQIHIYIE